MRLSMGMVFQDFNLFPHMTTLGNVIEGLVTVKKMSRRSAIPIGEKYLAKVGLLEKTRCYTHPPLRRSKAARRDRPRPGDGAEGDAVR